MVLGVLLSLYIEVILGSFDLIRYVSTSSNNIFHDLLKHTWSLKIRLGDFRSILNSEKTNSGMLTFSHLTFLCLLSRQFFYIIILLKIDILLTNSFQKLSAIFT